jgi:hypothetical protein
MVPVNWARFGDSYTKAAEISANAWLQAEWPVSTRRLNLLNPRLDSAATCPYCCLTLSMRPEYILGSKTRPEQENALCQRVCPSQPGFSSWDRQRREAQPFRNEVDGFLPRSRHRSAVLRGQVKPHSNDVRERKTTLKFHSRTPSLLQDCTSLPAIRGQKSTSYGKKLLTN